MLHITHGTKRLFADKTNLLWLRGNVPADLFEKTTQKNPFNSAKDQ